jgi:hypothetical protein
MSKSYCTSTKKIVSSGNKYKCIKLPDEIIKALDLDFNWSRSLSFDIDENGIVTIRKEV